MKTIKIGLLALFTLAGLAGIGQKKETDLNHRLAKADSILIIKLELTKAEQKAFLPLYHESVKEKKENRKKFLTLERKGKKRINDLSDAELDKVIEQRFAFKQGELDIQKKYHEKFKKALPMKKLAKFYQIEKKIYSREKGMQKSKNKAKKGEKEREDKR
jgi:hypothetical protein